MNASDKYFLAYLAIGFVVGCVMVWQWRKEDPRRFHWSQSIVAFVPIIWLLWPVILPALFPSRCDHRWFAITHHDEAGEYQMRCFRCGKVESRTRRDPGLPARGVTSHFRQNTAETETRVFVLTGMTLYVTAREFDTTERAHAYLELAERFDLDALLVRANSLDSVKRNHAGWIAGREVVFSHVS